LTKINYESLKLTLVRHEFDADTLDDNLYIEQHVEKNDETVNSESDEENMQSSVDIAPDAPVGTGDEGNDANVSPSVITLCDVPISNHIDWGSY
jgi:hypothetical protein